jgi:hypothetical protein
MATDKMAMMMAEEYFRWQAEVVTDWLGVFHGVPREEAVNEHTRLVHILSEREISKEDAALVGGIIEDTNTTFMIHFLGKHSGYTQREAMNTYFGVRHEFEIMADGLWEGHTIRWTKEQQERAQRDLALLEGAHCKEAEARLG